MSGPVWAVVRLDSYLEDLFVDRETPETPAETLLAVVRVFLSQERAEQDAGRLSSLVVSRGRGGRSSYYVKETDASPSALFAPRSPLVALIRLVDFDPLRPTTPDQVTVVGIYGSEDEANAARQRLPADEAPEYAILATRFRD